MWNLAAYEAGVSQGGSFPPPSSCICQRSLITLLQFYIILAAPEIATKLHQFFFFISDHFGNICHAPHRTNLQCPYSQKSSQRHPLTVCQISCFNHQRHNSNKILHISVGLIKVTCVYEQLIMLCRHFSLFL